MEKENLPFSCRTSTQSDSVILIIIFHLKVSSIKVVFFSLSAKLLLPEAQCCCGMVEHPEEEMADVAHPTDSPLEGTYRAYTMEAFDFPLPEDEAYVAAETTVAVPEIEEEGCCGFFNRICLSYITHLYDYITLPFINLGFHP